MSETVDEKAAHRRGITVTTVACLTGVAAGITSNVMQAGPTNRIGLVPLAVAIGLNYLILRVFDVDVEGFSTKDHFYTAFMSFALWFVTWGLLLSTA